MMKNFDTKLFISEIRKRRSIWDTSSTEHAIKELRIRDWDEVIDIFGGNTISPSDRHSVGFTLRKRWKNIRTCFARELKRQKNCGSGVGRKSEYMYYKDLLFLTNVMNIVEKDMDEEPEYNMCYNSNDIELQLVNDTIMRQYHKYKRKASDEDSYSDEEDEEDDDRRFLLSLYKTMKRIPRNKKMAVKIKMLSILNEVILDDENNRLLK
ncbi:unnamed protein product [Euphydryas editha]|uniref:MADF domain-containing protein n=1 Tax=Euphydryas editha TaxID=104508 RepID=A0AAU9U6F4_EUPED|nr:unnamed protein product [Euphydryas editha]